MACLITVPSRGQDCYATFGKEQFKTITKPNATRNKEILFNVEAQGKVGLLKSEVLLYTILYIARQTRNYDFLIISFVMKSIPFLHLVLPMGDYVRGKNLTLGLALNRNWSYQEWWHSKVLRADSNKKYRNSDYQRHRRMRGRPNFSGEGGIVPERE